jgi:pimeloyl-ACP methyl ester carboxylesterase
MKKMLAAAVGLMLAAAAVELIIEAREAPPYVFAQVGGARIRYQLMHADRSGPVVVFLNGIGASLEQWEGLQAEVSRATLAYDRGGAGFSSGASGYDVQAQADELFALLQELHVDRPVMLVGYSFSASIARIFAARHPDRTAGILLAEPYFAEIERDATTTHGPFRRYWRWLSHETFVSLFGFRRAWNALHAAPASSNARTTQAVLQRFSHWLAVDREWLGFGASAHEVEATPERTVPPAIIVTSPMHGVSYGPPMMKLYQGFIGRSRKGEIRIVEHLQHREFLNDPKSLTALAGAISDLCGG